MDMQLTESDIKLHLSKPIVFGSIHSKHFDPDIRRHHVTKEHLVPPSRRIIVIARSQQFSKSYLNIKVKIKDA